MVSCPSYATERQLLRRALREAGDLNNFFIQVGPSPCLPYTLTHAGTARLVLEVLG